MREENKRAASQSVVGATVCDYHTVVWPTSNTTQQQLRCIYRSFVYDFYYMQQVRNIILYTIFTNRIINGQVCAEGQHGGSGDTEINNDCVCPSNAVIGVCNQCFHPLVHALLQL